MEMVGGGALVIGSSDWLGEPWREESCVTIGRDHEGLGDCIGMWSSVSGYGHSAP